MKTENESPYEAPGFINLYTQRLHLRDHFSGDIKTHHLLLSDSKAMHYLQDIKTNSMAESEENLAFSISEICHADRTHVFLRMEERDTGLHVGEIGYTIEAFTPVGKLAGLGYFTYTHCWNKGYVTEAVKALLRYAFTKDNVIRMSAGCLKENIGSERVMQKCGFVKEAEFKQYAWHDGELKDRVVYRLLREEWLAAIHHNTEDEMRRNV